MKEARKEAGPGREWLLGTCETKQDPAGPSRVQKLLFVSCVLFVRGKKGRFRLLGLLKVFQRIDLQLVIRETEYKTLVPPV